MSYVVVRAENWAVHLIPQALVEDVASEAEARYRTPIRNREISPCEALTLDAGGMVHEHEPRIELGAVDGTPVFARASGWAGARAVLQHGIKKRPGMPWIKTYGWPGIIVLRTEDAGRLMSEIERQAKAADLMTTEFWNSRGRETQIQKRCLACRHRWSAAPGGGCPRCGEQRAVGIDPPGLSP